MKRRAFLKATMTGPWLLGSLGQANPSTNRRGLPQTSGMNVLFINVEDLAASAVGCYGNSVVQTPYLDRFAVEAVRFSRCYCQAPMCNPSRSSFLTGLRPDTTGVYDNDDPMDKRLPEGIRSLPEILHQYGFHTVNIGKLFHRTSTAATQLGAFDRLEYCTPPPCYRGQSQGLPPELREALRSLPKPAFTFSPDPKIERQMLALKAENDKLKSQAEPDSAERHRAQRAFQQPLANLFGSSGRLATQEPDGQKARLAAHILGQLAQQKRQFFMSLGFSRPHTPLRCPAEYLDMYDLADIPSPQADPAADVNIPPVAKRFGRNYDIFNSTYQGPVTDEVARRAIRAYYACVSFVDAQIGMVLEALKREGLSESTIVIISSDHGFQLGDHGLWSKYTLFEQSTRVPLLVRVPGLSNGLACDEIVELVDLLPTLCDLLVIPPPEKLEGASFVPLLKEPRQPWKLAAFSVCSIAGYIGRSVRTKRWRYTDWQSRRTSLRQFELYDLKTDPWEQTNLAQDEGYRNQRTLLANLLQRGWAAAHHRRADNSSVPVTPSSHRVGHILW